jgi:hypothetical protein
MGKTSILSIPEQIHWLTEICPQLARTLLTCL